MKLPQVHIAIVLEAKLVDYLLSPMHRRGKSKAAFFYGAGIQPRTMAGTGGGFAQARLDP